MKSAVYRRNGAIHFRDNIPPIGLLKINGNISLVSDSRSHLVKNYLEYYMQIFKRFYE